MRWEPNLLLLREKAFYVKYLGMSDRNTLMWVDISGTSYIYERAPNADPIKEIARKFQKMMSKGMSGGRALAWLKKNTLLRGKVPTSKAKGQMKEGLALDVSLPGDDDFVQFSGESKWDAIVNHNSFDIDDEDRAERMIDVYLESSITEGSNRDIANELVRRGWVLRTAAVSIYAYAPVLKKMRSSGSSVSELADYVEAQRR